MWLRPHGLTGGVALVSQLGARVEKKTMLMLKSDIVKTPTRTPPLSPLRVITAYLLNLIITVVFSVAAWVKPRVQPVASVMFI